MEEWGNQRANEYFEGNAPANLIRPKEGDPVRVVEKFIRDKYEHKKYISKTLPPPRVGSQSTATSIAPSPAIDSASDGRMNTPSPVPSNVRFGSGSPAPVAASRPAPAPVAAVNLLDFDAAPASIGYSGANIQQSPAVPEVPPPSIPNDVFSGFSNTVSNSYMNNGNSPHFANGAPAVPVPVQQHAVNNHSTGSVNSMFSADFSNFNSGSARPTPPLPSGGAATNDIFAAFSTPATAAPGAVGAKPSPSIDIMSLYASNNPQNNMMRGGMGMGGGAPPGGMMGGSPNGNMNMMGGNPAMMMGMNNMGNNMGGGMGMNMGGGMGMPPQQRGSMVGGYGGGMGVAGAPAMPMNNMGMNMGGNMMGNVRTTSPMPNPAGGGYGMGNPNMMGGQSPMMYPGAAGGMPGAQQQQQQVNNMPPVNAFAGFGNVGAANNNQRQW